MHIHSSCCCTKSLDLVHLVSGVSMQGDKHAVPQDKQLLLMLKIRMEPACCCACRDAVGDTCCGRALATIAATHQPAVLPMLGTVVRLWPLDWLIA